MMTLWWMRTSNWRPAPARPCFRDFVHLLVQLSVSSFNYLIYKWSSMVARSTIFAAFRSATVIVLFQSQIFIVSEVLKREKPTRGLASLTPNGDHCIFFRRATTRPVSPSPNRARVPGSGTLFASPFQITPVA